VIEGIVDADTSKDVKVGPSGSPMFEGYRNQMRPKETKRDQKRPKETKNDQKRPKIPKENCE
jgi:hypothetical protein